MQCVAHLCYNVHMATKSQTVRARVEPKLKRDAEVILRRVGLTSSEAIGLFYRRVTLEKGLPFEARIPNKETRRAIESIRKGNGVRVSFKEFARMVRNIK